MNRNESTSSNNNRCRHAQLDVNDFLGSWLISIGAPTSNELQRDV